MKPKVAKGLTLQQQRLKLEQFVQNFQDYTTQNVDVIYGRKKYLVKLQKIADDEDKVFEVQIQDAEEFFRKQGENIILLGIKHNTSRYIKIFTEIADKLMPQRIKAVDPERQIQDKYEGFLSEHRRERIISQISTGPTDKQEKLPFSLHRKYSVSIIHGNNQKNPIRTLSMLAAENIGNFVVTKGIVTRIGDVKPQIKVATYSCSVCGFQNYQEIFDSSYNPLVVCQAKKCKENKVSGRLIFLPGNSRFVNFQEIRIQQTPDQLRPGQIPLSKVLHLRDSLVNSCAPGDIILIQGVLFPTRKLGFGSQFQTSFTTHIRGLKVIREKKKYLEWSLTKAQVDKVRQVRQTYSEQELYKKLSETIAPQIFGLQEVKKALLLMMVNGVTKQTATDNLKIRGQINIALIGDPGVAKSQLLKKVANISPRAIYTTGKGSSGVGLTAAIVTDPTTKQISLQAGALVLADMGICCIDEFDKMDQYDRTAIHQAMQQQTISIAKAGITTTLNSRTSILAAANPLFGRYKRSESIYKNINLPAALLSRFDIIFVLIDKAEQKKDIQLAYHISQVHMTGKIPENKTAFDVNFLRTYLALAKQYTPVIPEPLQKIFISKYIEKRKMQAEVSKEGESNTTTRSLLAMIRLSMARAKLRFSNQVSEQDIQDILQLMQKSTEDVTNYNSQNTRKARHDSMSQIYSMIRGLCLYNGKKTISLELIKDKIVMKGFTIEELDSVLVHYQQLCVISVENDYIELLK